MAGNVGAEDLEAAGAELEAAIKRRDADAPGEKLERFRVALGAVVEALRPAVEEAREDSGREGAPGTSGDPETLRALLVELDPHLGKRKPKPAKDVVRKLAGFEWAGDDAEAVKEIGRLVGKYRFKEAQTVVADILKRLGGDGDRAARVSQPSHQIP